MHVVVTGKIIAGDPDESDGEIFGVYEDAFKARDAVRAAIRADDPAMRDKDWSTFPVKKFGEKP